MARQIVLASASPRRRELLTAAGLDFAVLTSGIDEDTEPGSDPAAMAMDLALAKAREVAARLENAVVLGADTVVVIDGSVLGKPYDGADAARMLRLLRNRRHQVITGIALVETGSGRTAVQAVTTGVRMADYSDQAILDYVNSGEPLDKAGSYAIQGLGGELVAEIDGSYTNVVGLPVSEVAAMFEAYGIPWPAPKEEIHEVARIKAARRRTKK